MTSTEEEDAEDPDLGMLALLSKEEIDEELRAAGFDPEKVHETGRQLNAAIRKLKPGDADALRETFAKILLSAKWDKEEP